MKRFIWLLLLLPLGLMAQTVPDRAITGWCHSGATNAKTSGMSSTNTLQGNVPNCTVTVFQTGTTTLATIHADGASTPLSNPFTATNIGQWTFFAQPGVGYDIVLSGGTPGNRYPNPVTLTAVMVGGGGGGGGSTNPGGNPPEVQYNANGFFGGDPGLTYNDQTQTLYVGGQLTPGAPTVTIGPHAPPPASWTFDTYSPQSAQQSILGLSPSFLPVCPNGTSGALTTAGCQIPPGGIPGLGSDGSNGIQVAGTVSAAQTVTGTTYLGVPTIAALNSAISALSSGGAIRINGTVNVTSSLSLPANIAVTMDQGGIFNVASGQTLTVNGSFTAPLTQVFSGSGTVVFARGIQRGIYVGWWQPAAATTWDAAVTSALASCVASNTWCELPSSLTTQTTITLANYTMLRSLAYAGAGGNGSASYGTAWTIAPTATNIDGVYSTQRFIQIQGVSFIASNANGNYPRSAIYFNGVGDCAIEHIQAGGPFAVAGILLSGLQECQIGSSNTGVNIINGNTTTAMPAGVRLLGPGSTPVGTLSTTTDFHKLTVNGAAGATGGINTGLLFDGDGCLGCNVYNAMIETLTGNAINIGKGNSVDIYSLYTENIPNTNTAVGIIRIGQDYPSAAYGTYVNINGGEILGLNGTATLSYAFDLGNVISLVVNGSQIGRVGFFQSSSGTCSTCRWSFGNIISSTNAGFGTITYPINVTLFGTNRMNTGTLAPASLAYPQGGAQQGLSASAPIVYRQPGNMYMSTDYGPEFWRQQVCSGVTVSITASGAITAATPSGGTNCVVGDILPVVQAGGSNGQLVATAVSSGAVTAASVLTGGSGYATASGLSVTALNGAWVNAHGSALLGSTVLYRCTTAGTLPVGATTTVTANCGASVDTGLRVQ